MTAAESVSPSTPVSTLLGDVESFERLLDRGVPVAVVGPPFAGRKRVLDHARDRLDADRVQLSPDTDPAAVTSAVGDGPLVVENCQQLYRREVGGFESVDAFLGTLAGTETPVVTGWNSYAWSYLDAVRDIGSDFDPVELSPLSRDAIAETIRSQAATMPTFRNDEPDESLVTLREHPLGWRGLTVRLPTVERRAFATRFGSPSEPEAAVFDHLTSVTGGNPGVARAIWDRADTAGELRPGDIHVPSVDPDHEEAFLLRIVLAGETVDRTFLAERFGSRLDRLLAGLIRSGIVTERGERVSLEPAGVPAAIGATKKNRIL